MTSPYNFPVAGTDVTSGSTVHVSLTAQVTYTTPQVLGLNVNRRGCLYENESRSLGFPNYSHGNCIAQCHRRSTLLYCNCTPYFYPTEGVKISSRATIALRNRRFFWGGGTNGCNWTGAHRGTLLLSLWVLSPGA